MSTTNWNGTRRDMLKLSAALGVAGFLCPVGAVLAQNKLKGTPEQILGPFYPIAKVADASGDLTRIPGRSGRAKGQVITVGGRVLNRDGEPVRGARLEIWQANEAGRYAHPMDTNPAPLDPNFEGFATLTTDAEGRYHFRTIKPGAYPAGPSITRPSHIHFDVIGHQDRRLVTQMYFEGDPWLEKDRWLQSASRPNQLIVKLQPGAADAEAGSMQATFDIVLA